MCTQEQVREAIDMELFQPKPGEDKGRLDKHLDYVLNRLFWQIFWKLALPMIGSICALTVAWFSLQGQVNENSKELIIGGRYTQEEHNMYAEEVDRRFAETEKSRQAIQQNLNDQLVEIKTDLRFIREQLTAR